LDDALILPHPANPKELERRGHRFVRYADDCNMYVRSERAGQRVMESITRFITQKLKLKVNQGTTAGTEVPWIKIYGWPGHQAHNRAKSLERFKQRIRDITRRAKGVSITATMEELATVYAGLAQLFWLLRNARGVGRSHSLGPVAIAGRPLASVENTTSSPCGTDRQRGLVMGCQEHGRQRPQFLVSRPQ